MASRTIAVEALRSLGFLPVPVCPEQLGGLSTPRTPAEIQGGDGKDVIAERASVVDAEGQIRTREFLAGAEAALAIARASGAKKFVTQRRSPSCSAGGIYDGGFSHTLRPGPGVAAAYLEQHGLELLDVDELLPE